MKKLFTIVTMLAVVGVGILQARQDDLFVTGQHDECRITSEGSLVSNSSGSFRKQITVQEGFILDNEEWITPAAFSSSSVKVDLIISTGQLTGNGTSWCNHYRDGEFTQSTSAYSRNVTILFSTGLAQVPSGIIKGTCTVTGYNANGQIVTDTIHISTALYTEGTYVYGTGNIAFIEISTITVKTTNAYVNTLELHIGQGNKFGLKNNIDLATDIVKIWEATTNIKTFNTSLSIDTTYNTIDFVTNPNGLTSYRIWYKPRSRY